MRPHPAFSIGGAAARAIRNGPLTLASMTMRQIRGSVSQNRVGSVRKRSLTYFMPRPALLISTSSLPKRFERLIDQTLAVFLLRHVGDDSGRHAFGRFGGDALDFRALARRGDDDAGARLDQAPRHRAPEPAAAAGDERDLSWSGASSNPP